MSSLRNRLTLALSLVLLAMAALLAVGLQHFPRQLVERYVASRLEHDAETLYVRMVEAPDPASAAADALGPVYALPLSGHYFVVQRTIRTAAQEVPATETIVSRSLWDEDLPIAALSGGSERTARRPGPAGQTLLAYTRRFSGTNAEWTVTLAEDLSRLDAAIARFRRVLLASMLVALLALAWLQRAIVVRGLAPLARAVDACRRLERGESASVPSVAPDEVRPMLEAVDRLVHHQTQRLARVRHAAGNLSHALKTPLAVLAQVADERASAGDASAADAIREQVDSMRATIEREMRRARLAGSGVRTEGFEARGQLDALAEALGRLHAQRSLHIEVVAPEKRLPLDREDMLELFGNLLDNACKWARTTVRVEIAEERDVAAFRVDDDGPGVDDALLERLGRGSLRTDESRPGHGLGLTIVADIVSQYGGTIEYRRSPLGGLGVRGTLPLEEAHAR
ncbi:MAG TPA: sensor histidine kinase [Zeimonas sp.]